MTLYEIEEGRIEGHEAQLVGNRSRLGRRESDGGEERYGRERGAEMHLVLGMREI